ncbi:hypothetical protein ACSU64_17460 [Bacillaceae bacterium C204]|uniref:hypothetical protein n=1 Tax=Neobacillus sp. 204 TaxID=3383351 RepID=UPI00397925CF
MKSFYGLLSQYFYRIYRTFIERVQYRSYKRRLKNTYRWGLGVEVPFFFSSKFVIENSSITITGTQQTYDNSWPIRYSIIKTSKLGISIKYFDSIDLYGDHTNGEFQHTFKSIPNGTGYQMEVFNYFKYHSTGRIRIISKPKKEIESS